MKIIFFLFCVLLLLLSSQLLGYGQDAFPPVVGQLKYHNVQSGEDLYDIGLKYHVAIDHIMWANNVNTLKVPSGTVLTIPSMRIVPASLDEGLVLNLPERMLYLFEKEKPVSWYPVAIGAAGKWMTPTGDTKIANKAKNPTWLPPEWAGKEEPVAPGPDNPLGDRWIGLSLPGYGIHATNSPLSIGMAASHGCIRMNPRDAQDLYDRVKVGMTVRIIYEPVVIGRSEHDGMIYLSVYPDVYGRIPDMRAEFASRLGKSGLESIVDSSNSEAMLIKKKGLPEPIMGSAIVIKVNDRTVPLSFPPVTRDGKILVLSEILKFLGAQISRNEEAKSIEIVKGEHKFTLSYDGNNTLPVWKGRILIPLRETVENLGLSLKWEPKEHVIHILGAGVPSQNEPATSDNNAEEKDSYEEKVRAIQEKF